MTLRLFLVLSVSGCAFSAKYPSRMYSFAGPFEVFMKQLEACPQQMTGKNTIRIHGRVHYIREYHEPRFSGTIESLVPIDNNISVQFTSASWNRVSGWVPNAVIIRDFGKMCTLFHTVLNPVRELLEANEVNHQSYCPRDPGNYTVRNMPVKFPVGKLAVFPYGRYRGETFFIRNNTRTACVRAYLDVVPISEKLA